MSFDQKKKNKKAELFMDLAHTYTIRLTSKQLNSLATMLFDLSFASYFFFVVVAIFAILSPIPQQLIRTWIIYSFRVDSTEYLIERN